METFGAVKNVDPSSAEESRAKEILHSTTFHDGKKYVVGMLWQEPDIELPNNYYAALAQLKSLENRLGKDADLRERYAQLIKNDLEKGYVKTVEPSESQKRSKREWYLPHHLVLNPNKPGKVRRVLNGAALFHKQSPNSALMAGPDLLQNLLYIILKFRQHRYAASADIEGMFLQVGVPDQDQTSLRFFVAGGCRVRELNRRVCLFSELVTGVTVAMVAQRYAPGTRKRKVRRSIVIKLLQGWGRKQCVAISKISIEGDPEIF